MENLAKMFNGVAVKLEGNNVSLTDLWKASGAEDSKRPARWAESISVQTFVFTVASKLNIGISDIITSKRGRNGGTYAHRQIALAYAKYLSPELHMFVNECFFDRLEEEADPELAISRGRERAIKIWQSQGKLIILRNSRGQTGNQRYFPQLNKIFRRVENPTA